MDSLTQSLINPSSELLLWGGVVGIVLGVIVILIGIIAKIIVKKSKSKNICWWIIVIGGIAIVTGIMTLLRAQ
ncbi:MAG: hypothetical protein ACERKZ_16550 [Lachnotalea sp.]